MTGPSYRALFALPSVGRLLVGMQVARIAHSMVSVTMVLFTLSTYRSSSIAGLAAFFSIFPGLLVSPIAGALLDRHGRTRLVALDYVVALVSLTLIGVLALLHTIPVWLLILIAAIAFAVSMAFNYTGIPIGAAVAGAVAASSIEAAITFGVVTCLASGILASILIPSTE